MTDATSSHIRTVEQDLPLLRMEGICKSFSGVPVLSDVQFELRRGEVHVLAGENGAGKSTLIKILAGVYDDYSGTIKLDGRSIRFSSPHDATRRGISVIYQEMSLIGPMSVVDNIYLGREITRAGAGIDVRAELKKVKDLLSDVGLDIEPSRPVEEYPISVRQLVEIAKALAIKANIIIMDEPTSSLGELEVERLFAIIRALKSRGCGVIYISHKMEEIYRIADRISVLRDGRYIGTAQAADFPQSNLIQWMVGREVSQQFPRRATVYGTPRLRVEQLSLRDPASPSGYVVRDVSFQVHAGEILGVAGLHGSGNTELLNGLFGAYGPPAEAKVYLDGELFEIRSPRDSVTRGLALLTNDRQGTGLVTIMDVTQNVTLAALRRFSPWGWMMPRAERRAAVARSQSLRLKAASLDQEVSTLSGGNQQKVVLAKWLETRPKVFLLDEPTRGVDVGVKQEIYELMSTWIEEGCAILLITSEMPELLAMSDRILVMSRGRVTAEFPRTEATQERILQAAMG